MLYYEKQFEEVVGFSDYEFALITVCIIIVVLIIAEKSNTRKVFGWKVLFDIDSPAWPDHNSNVFILVAYNSYISGLKRKHNMSQMRLTKYSQL